MQVIAARGIEGITFRSVAEQAGFPPSTTSYFFATVDDLIEVALLRVAATVVARIEALIGRAGSAQIAPDQLAAELIAVVADPSHDDPLPSSRPTSRCVVARPWLPSSPGSRRPWTRRAQLVCPRWQFATPTLPDARLSR